MKNEQIALNTNELITIKEDKTMKTNTAIATKYEPIDTRIIGSQILSKNESIAEKVKQTQSGIIIKPKNLVGSYPQLEHFKHPLIKIVAVKDKIIKINPCLFGGDELTLVFASVDNIHVTDFELLKYRFNFTENDSYAVVKVDDVELIVSLAIVPSIKQKIEDGEIANEGEKVESAWFKTPPNRIIMAKSLPLNEKFKVVNIHQKTLSQYGGKTVDLKNVVTGEKVTNVVCNKELTRLVNIHNLELTFTITNVEKVMEKVTKNKKTFKEEKVYLTINCHNEDLKVEGI